MHTLIAKIEGVLFWKGEPMKISELAEILSSNTSEIKEALETLRKELQERGIRLIENNESVSLATAPLVSGIIEKLTKEELEKDIGRAGLETLSIILYQGPVSRSQIDYIRGVNSSFILRNLLIRGLIEKINNPHDQRGFLYQATIELLSFLGVESREALPQFENIKNEIERIQHQEEEGQEAPR